MIVYSKEPLTEKLFNFDFMVRGCQTMTIEDMFLVLNIEPIDIPEGFAYYDMFDENLDRIVCKGRKAQEFIHEFHQRICEQHRADFITSEVEISYDEHGDMFSKHLYVKTYTWK